MIQPNNRKYLRDVVGLAQRLGQVFGVCPLYLPKDATAVPKSSNWRILYSLIVLIGYGFTCLPIIFKTEAHIIESKLGSILWTFVDVHMNRLLGILIILTGIIQRKCIIRAFKYMSEVDEILKPFGIRKHIYSKTYKYCVQVIVFGFIACVLSSLLCIYDFMRNFCEMLIALLMYAIIGQLLVYLRLIREQSKFLNSMVSNYQTKMVFKEIPWCNKTILTEIVPVVHYKLSDAVQEVNKAYMIFFFTLVTQTLLGNIFALFGGYQLLYGERTAWETTLVAYSYINLSAFSLGFLIKILSGCSDVADEANKMGKLVHKIINSNPELSEDENLKTFSFQLIHGEIQFTVCDMFPLDYSYLYTLTTVVTTYMIILIQFDLARVVVTPSPPPANSSAI